MSTATGLITIDNDMVAKALLQEGEMQILVDRVKGEVAEFVPDMTTIKGRKAIASMANKIARTKTQVDGFGKDMVKQIQEARKLCVSELDAMKLEVRKDLTEYEEAIKADETDIVAMDKILKTLLPGALSTQIKAKIESMAKYALKLEGGEVHDDIEERYAKEFNDTIDTLNELFAAAVHHEAEAAELEALRKEKAEREAAAAAEAAQKPEKASEPAPEPKPAPAAKAVTTPQEPSKTAAQTMTKETIEDLTRYMTSLAAETLVAAIVHGKIRNLSLRKERF